MYAQGVKMQKVFVLVLLALLAACQSPTPATIKLVSSVPNHNATGVSLGSGLRLEFSGAVNAATFQASLTPSVGLQATWTSPSRVELQPSNNLNPASDYILSFLGSGATGATLQPTTIAFRTAAASQIANHPKILLGSVRAALTQKLSRNEPSATRFLEMVNRALGGANIYGYEGWWSGLIGQLTGEAHYCLDAVQRGEAWVSSEASRTGAGNRAAVAGDSYLEVGPIIGNLMLTYDFCFEQLTPTQRQNWRTYAKQAIWNVWNHSQANWGAASNAWRGTPEAHSWSGWSVNDPVNNYYYSFLQATMFFALATIGEDDSSSGYLEFFRTEKIQNQLVPMFAAQLGGGGSREGTGYGTAQKNLFRLYYFWQHSTGERIADLTSHAFETMAYQLHAILPTNNRLAPIGDHARDETAMFYDYHRELLLALAQLYRGTPLAARVLNSLTQMVSEGQMGRMRFQDNYIWDFLYQEAETASPANLNTVYHATGTGHIFARSSWHTDATWFGFLAGAYTQSHAHQDGLSLLLYKNNWLVHDLNMNLPSGIEQGMNMHASLQLEDFTPSERPDSSARLLALQNTPEFLFLHANQGTLYRNTNVRIERQVLWFKPNVVLLCDHATLQGSPNPTSSTFRLPLPAQASLGAQSAQMNLAGSSLSLHWLTPNPVTLQQTVVGGGARLEVRQSATGKHEWVTALGIDNAISSLTQNAGTIGVGLRDGRSLKVRCHGASDGFFALENAAGQEIQRTTLSKQVQTLAITQ
jgi:hypothetical protein